MPALIEKRRGKTYDIVKTSVGRLAGWEKSLRTKSNPEAGFTRTLVAALAGFLLFAIAPANALKAAELVMFEEAGCMWCQRWNEEIGVVYDRTSQGRLAPLRRLDANQPLPPDLRGLDRASYTPTFVLVEDGRDIGRILGYPGEHFFWGMLDKLIAKLPSGSLIEPPPLDPSTRAKNDAKVRPVRQISHQ